MPSQDYISSYLPGAHFWPFNETSLGPTIPAYLYETNEGLVLDRSMQDRQIDLQIAFIDDISNHLAWLDANIDTINMDATRRSRRDVRLGQTYSVGNISQALTNEIAELVLLNSSQCVLQNCELRFNTSDLTMVGAINGTGSVQMTANGTEVALFSFNSIRLGPEVQVTVVGQRPLVLSSRTSILLNTSISAAPGTLGGFPGGGSVARLANESLIDNPQLVMICDLLNICDFSRTNTNFSASDRASFISNNVNGPGSGNLRVYPFVIQTEADVIYEVQSIQTQARSGQTLAGGFTLSYRSFVTPRIPHDVSSVMLKDIIESNMNTYPVRSSQRVAMLRSEGPVGIGRVEVSRSVADQVGGYEWRITFTSAIGDLPQILATSFLQGLEANISTSTLVNGNEINGTFVLSFNNETSPILLSTETAAGMKTKLLQMPTVSTAFVLRTDPTGLCDDGLCMNGPLNARGYIWTVFLTVDEEYGNATPYSPTSPTAQLNVTAASIFLNTSNLSGTGATAYLSLGFASSSEEILNALSLTFPFSLAYGGAGGSYGGRGGQGYGDNPTGALYGDETISDLFGGSGGSMRAALPFDESTFAGVGTGLGGAGGGALELIAINDITIGSFGSLIARGQDGIFLVFNMYIFVM